MNDSIEAMKLVANISRETGVFEGENGMLKMRVNDLQKQIEQLQARVDEKDKALQASERRAEDYRHRIAELESLMTTGGGKSPVVVVNQYFLLDRPKTMNYVGKLDNIHKMFAGHMLLHTMADSTPKQLIDEVNDMTRLEAGQTDRLVDAIKEAGEKPRVSMNDVTFQGAMYEVSDNNEVIFGRGEKR